MSAGTFYNPATLVSVRLDTDPAQLATVHDRKVIIGLSAKHNQATYTGSSTFFLRFPPLVGPITPITATGTAKSNTTVYVPAFNWSVRLNPRWIAGLKIGEPANASIEYPSTSSAKYTGYKNNIVTVSIGPELAYQFNKKLSIGFGVDMQRTSLKFAAAVPVPTTAIPPPLTTTDYQFNAKYSDWSAGWNTGLFYQPRRGTYLGLTYFSKVKFHLLGTASIAGSGGRLPSFATESSARMTTPWSIRFDAFQAFNMKWGINASAEFVKWSVLQRIILQNTPLGDFSQQYKYKDTWRYALGGRYQPGPKWSFFAGVSYLESPANPNLQRPILPIKNFYSLGLAAERYFSKNVSAKLSYRHGFIGRSTIDYAALVTAADGSVNSSGDIVEIMLTLKK